MKGAFGVALLTMIAAAAGAAAAVYAVKKREELEQYDYSFDDDDEIYFGDDDGCDCRSCSEKDDCDDADDVSSDVEELEALDGAVFLFFRIGHAYFHFVEGEAHIFECLDVILCGTGVAVCDGHRCPVVGNINENFLYAEIRVKDFLCLFTDGGKFIH